MREHEAVAAGYFNAYGARNARGHQGSITENIPTEKRKIVRILIKQFACKKEGFSESIPVVENSPFKVQNDFHLKMLTDEEMWPRGISNIYLFSEMAYLRDGAQALALLYVHDYAPLERRSTGSQYLLLKKARGRWAVFYDHRVHYGTPW